MAAETRAEKARDARDEKSKENREKYVAMVSGGSKQVDAMKKCNLSRSTAKRITAANKKALSGDDAALRKLLDPHGNRAGKRPVVSECESAMIVDQAKRAEPRGLPINLYRLKSIMGKVADDGRRGYKRGVPSDKVIRKFRSSHRELTVRTSRANDLAKVKAETYEHVVTFKERLMILQARYPDIFNNPAYFWNMDETEVDSEKMRKERVLSDSKRRDGGQRVNGIGGGGMHVTDVVAVNAAGDMVAPFLILQGKNFQTGWLEPLNLDPKTIRTAPGGVNLTPYCDPGWFPADGALYMSEKGSMTTDLMPAFLQHLLQQQKKLYPESVGKRSTVSLDGHSSRSFVDTQWIEEAVKNLQEIILSPANTTHFLQACDHLINMLLARWVTMTKEACLLNGIVGVSTPQIKLICAVESHKHVSRTDIVASFEKIGLWPMDYIFVEYSVVKYGMKVPECAGSASNAVVPAGAGTTAGEAAGSSSGRCPAKRGRKTDAVVVEEMQAILADESNEMPRRLQSLAIKMRAEETCNSILQDVVRLDPSTQAAPKKKSQRMPDGQSKTSGGTPAMYLTAGGMIEQFEAAKAETKAVEDRKIAKIEAQKQAKAVELARIASAREIREQKTAEKKRVLA